MSEHTPGPWRATKDRHDDYWSVRSERFHIAAVTLEATPDVTGKANARLLAAAPALLAACERIQRALYLLGVDTPGLLELLDEAAPEVDAAIAAAKEGN